MAPLHHCATAPLRHDGEGSGGELVWREDQDFIPARHNATYAIAP
jgi:hypothetical protein